jgi:hypothetical protein
MYKQKYGKRYNAYMLSQLIECYEVKVPLSFDSISHGSIAFGFFNIESDMLLLEHYFIFADKFCGYINGYIKNNKKTDTFVWDIYYIKEPQKVGDLMGAINGVRYTGFIGELYKKFPFPEHPEKFKQNPYGIKNKEIVNKIILKYGEKIKIHFKYKNSRIHIGDYKFDKRSFHELVNYMWLGGYPGWKNNIRPDYVLNMKKNIEKGNSELFKGMIFT